jgi:antitoxin PrlF
MQKQRLIYLRVPASELAFFGRISYILSFRGKGLLSVNAPISRLTSKSQTVIPKVVRERLGLKPGDLLRYVVEGDRVVIERIKNETEDDPFAAFTEWASEADERAYKSL